MPRPTTPRSLLLPLLLFGCVAARPLSDGASGSAPRLSDERLVLQTTFGDLELAFYPDVAPKTVEHILKLGRLGAYNSNHFFRVDKGFVAQVADVVGGRSAPLSRLQREEGSKSVPGEFSDVKHVRGTLSMGRYDDPNSATSSFSILLGPAPHLDHQARASAPFVCAFLGRERVTDALRTILSCPSIHVTQYAVFGTLVAGDDALTRMEQVETRREGIFVMPKDRIDIVSSYVYSTADADGAGGEGAAGHPARLKQLTASLTECHAQLQGLRMDLQSLRSAKLP
jgi:cyclophilin family peptidyl-prolyl cis-trans isomerase